MNLLLLLWPGVSVAACRLSHLRPLTIAVTLLGCVVVVIPDNSSCAALNSFQLCFVGVRVQVAAYSSRGLKNSL